MRISCGWSVLIASFAVALWGPLAARAASFFEIRISAHDASPGDEFGFSASVSGDTAVVGAHLSTAFPGCQTDDPAQLALCVEQAVACQVCVALDQADDLALSCDLVDDASENASCP